jgi:gliding motility-associated-like protein
MKTNKSILLVLLCIVYVLVLKAQETTLYSKTNNYTTFSKDVYIQHPDVAKFTDSTFYSHPDYRKISANWGCKDCAELLQKRTATSRYYVSLGTDGNEFYQQESYFPLHYKTKENEWVSIDYRMRPLTDGQFGAIQQPVQTFYDSKTHIASLVSESSTISFGDHLAIYSVGAFDKKRFLLEDAGQNYSNYTAGDDGIYLHDISKNIDIEYNFKKGAIKTSYVLRTKPTLPLVDQFMIVEVPLHVGVGDKIIKNSDGSYTDGEGNYNGGYDIINSKGEKVFKIEKPVYYDANFVVYPGFFELRQIDGSYHLLYKIPLAAIHSTSFQYPLTIDPYVTGYNKFGNYGSTGLASANMNFTYYLRGSCDYSLAVTVPGKSDIIATFVEVEDENTLSTTCNSPPVPLPSCRRHDIRHTFRSNECGTSTGLSAPALPAGEIDTPGTVTTDSALIRGAAPILIAGMLDCMRPQCPDYVLNFTLGNIENLCNDLCNNNCAVGNMWAVTIRARKLEGYMTPNKVLVCVGEPVTLTAYPSWGVPPYHYVWSNGDTGRSITIYPTTSGYYAVDIYDTCDVRVRDDTLIEVIPSPTADAGSDKSLCEGGTVTIGGSPAISSGASAIWTSTTALASSYISGVGSENPNINIPTGLTGVFTYILEAIDFRCFRYDTMRIYSYPNPSPYVVPDTGAFICAGGSIDLSTTNAYASYAWSTGSTTQTSSVTQAGSYLVTVTDNNGCVGISNAVTLNVKPVLSVLAYPDTMIDPEESARLYSDLNLYDINIDSFYWSPPMFLNSDTSSNPLSTPADDIVYYLNVLSDGCWTGDSASIRINYPFDFYVPNAFTPNADGYNDDFFYIGSKVLTCKKFQIYDRYGEKLWDLPLPWPGIYKGVLLQPGVYVYYLEVEFRGEVRSAKGSVTLLR